jgi:osmotically-inducible protein OsmY
MKTTVTPDEVLREAILVALTHDRRITVDQLRVGVSNAIAHLAGKVDSLESRDLVESLVKQVPGVRGVVNRIECPGAPSPARTVNLDLND